MCGFIAGKNIDRDLSKYIEEMKWRGLPGFEGYLKFKKSKMYLEDQEFQFAHVSLPMSNLDPLKAIQPVMIGDNPNLFVGEIFNYKNFGDYATDQEACSDLFWKEGLDFFHNFDGFWSFISVIDGEMIGVTDYLAQKPIYYREDIEILASEIDVLRDFGPVTPNKLFLSNVMKWGYDPLGNTPWNEIKMVPPGHYYHGGEIKKYWDWSRIKPGNLREDLLRAVNLRLGGERDVPILLSGGLDSSIIYGLIKESGRDIKALHVENGEASFAEMVCNDLVKVSLSDVGDREAIAIHQSPVDLGSVKPQIAMARKLRELGFYTVLTGDGADELFGGYRRAKEYDSQHSDVFCELPYYHLPKLDRTMMRSTIELRAPFLAPSIIAYALNLPWNERNGIKKVLVETFGDIVPQKILDRTKRPLKTEDIRMNPLESRKKNLEIWRDINE